MNTNFHDRMAEAIQEKEGIDSLIDSDIQDKLDDLKQTASEAKQHVKKIQPDWDMEKIREMMSRPEISNGFVRSVAENLNLFCDHETEYLDKNCKWNVLYPSMLLDKLKEQKVDECNDWVKKDRRQIDTDWHREIFDDADPAPRYFLGDL